MKRLLAATKKRVFLLHDVHRKAPCLLQSRWAMSYLRGPLTRDEISRLTKAKPTAAASAAPRAEAAPGGPPVLPPPFRHLYLARRRGEVAAAHLLVKYAVRYKGLDEVVGVKAWPLAGATPADTLEAEPVEVDEGAVVADAPPGLRYLDPPEWLASAGSKGIERALKERLDDQLAVTVFRDPVTKSLSVPGETREAFAARVAGGGAAAEKLRQKLDKKRSDLAVRDQEVAGRKQEKWLAIGSAVLSNIGLLTGKKRSVSGVGSVLSKNRMEGTAEARLEALRAEVASSSGSSPRRPRWTPTGSSRSRWLRCAAGWGCSATTSSGCSEPWPTSTCFTCRTEPSTGRSTDPPSRRGAARAGFPRRRSSGPRARPSGFPSTRRSRRPTPRRRPPLRPDRRALPPPPPPRTAPRRCPRCACPPSTGRRPRRRRGPLLPRRLPCPGPSCWASSASRSWWRSSPAWWPSCAPTSPSGARSPR